MDKTCQTSGSEKLRFGDLLVKEGLVTRSQVDAALAIQARDKNYRPLGRILVDLNALSLGQLKAFVDAKQIRPRLGELLVKANVLTQEQLGEALEHAKQHKTRLGEALLQRGLCTEEAVKNALALQLSIEFVDLDNLKIATFPMNLINGNYARKQKICPLQHSTAEITVAMDDPTNVALQREIAVSTGLRIKVVTAVLPAIMKALTQAYPHLAPDKEAVLKLADVSAIDPTLELIIDENFEYAQKGQGR
jgi:hypothetical protein